MRDQAILAALATVAEDRTGIPRWEIDRLLATYAQSFGAYMILRLLLKSKPAGLQPCINLFRFAFAKDEFLGPALKPQSPVLSIGSGLGQVESWLAARGHRVTGVDVNLDTVAAARMLASSDEGVPENPAFVLVEGVDLPFDPESFRSVLYLSSLHELTDRQASLAEAHRVLTPGGTLLAGEDEFTWRRLPLLRDVEAAGFRPESEERLPEILDHGVASAYVVRRFARV